MASLTSVEQASLVQLLQDLRAKEKQGDKTSASISYPAWTSFLTIFGSFLPKTNDRPGA